MEPHLSIDEVAQRTGLTAHTLRYYERIGLIAPVRRAGGGQRRYAAADLAWIEFLLRLRTTRMPVSKMRAFARLRAAGESTIPERRAMLEAHLAEVLADIDAMRGAAGVLREKIGFYRNAEEVAVEPACGASASASASGSAGLAADAGRVLAKNA
ncbi:MerR family transcriptional regulator [Pseudoduganella albidiflava]|uniref:MerR family transcriptional regulator n=1 Tax=Pseudoduganella albidiflava TaxID=321983 RepID=A0A411X0X2_9BURK|nr:MerR family transcriptional regulator [Pseudoduganella albidiflava]QBI02626.1 MerR family transcriptional regulator [Pseudoduganella albidiflava]GGY41206.1 MerR family transcriptional regulator [Pseudoduganella albidiflava]